MRRCRPGGMEKPTDDHKLTHQTILAPANTRFGGNISRLQARCALLPTFVLRRDPCG